MGYRDACILQLREDWIRIDERVRRLEHMEFGVMSDEKRPTSGEVIAVLLSLTAFFWALLLVIWA